jgi:hypothetical protein
MPEAVADIIVDAVAATTPLRESLVTADR